MAIGRKNVIKIDPLNYNIGLIGEGGIGKTTIIKEMCEKLAGEDGYLFAECGKEDGADAINGINYVNCPEWNGEYDEVTNSVGFQDLINDIVENKDAEYPNLKVLVVDTFDQLRSIVEPEVIRLHNKANPDRRITSIKAAFGGYMAGEDMADDIILDRLWELKKVGVHFIVIGHVKQREITDASTGDSYTQLTTDMSMRSFNKIKTKLHFLGVASIDREIVKEKKNKKDANVIKSETRKITFRDDNYAMDSKSRFADIIDEIPFTSDDLIKALTDAIEREAQKGSKSVAELKKEQDAEKKIADKRASEYSAKKVATKIDAERNEELIDIIKSKFTSADDDTKAKVKEIMAENGIAKFNDPEGTPTKPLEEIVALLQ